MTANGSSNRLTAAQVLRRYADEGLPAFCEIHLEAVNQAGNFGERPLHVASVRGNMEEIAALVEAGADVNAPGELLNTPLHEAVGQGHIDAIRFLLEHGASPCAENELGDTPLAMAKVKDRADIMDLLRSWRGAKADEHARDRVRHEP